MTPRQEIYLTKVRALIADARTLLDDLMYHGDPLPENEFRKIREAYDLICKANDKL